MLVIRLDAFEGYCGYNLDAFEGYCGYHDNAILGLWSQNSPASD